jgi:hypothetical protein
MAAGSTYEPIATTTLGSAAGTIDFTNISQAYTDIVAIASVRSNGATNWFTARWGNNSYDSGSNYSLTGLFARRNGSNSAEEFGSERRTNSTSIAPYTDMPAATSTFGTAIFHFQNYSNTATFKNILYRYNGLSSSNYAYAGTEASAVLWRNTAAINQIRFYINANDLAVGTTVTLYGIAAA